MYHIKDKMDSYLPIAFRQFAPLPQVHEGLVFMKLGHLKGSRVLPLSVAIVLVKFDSMVVILWTSCTILIAQCLAAGPELGLVNHPEKFLVSSGNAFKPLPSIKIK